MVGDNLHNAVLPSDPPMSEVELVREASATWRAEKDRALFALRREAMSQRQPKGQGARAP